MVERFDIGSRMSQAVVHNGTVYIAGQVADNSNGTIAQQTWDVLHKIEALLAKADVTKSDLLAVNVYLPDIADFEAMNLIYDAWIDANNPPVRACVEARLADPALRVEMTAVAAKRRD